MNGDVLTPASVLLAIASPSTAANRGASFLKEAMRDDNSDTTLGSIAASGGASAGVRDFSRKLSTTGGATRRQLRLRGKCTWRPPTRWRRKPFLNALSQFAFAVGHSIVSSPATWYTTTIRRLPTSVQRSRAGTADP